ncbi:heterodisulfide reductase subunit B [Desulfohalotomaculum tongense]|uniref:CoB--CoM heterodisulfide reductase iron-sulfur subunit B family protein n=1 Tax=Desulforadius tongensis TaxID=1216062 RepID=UPI0019571B1C|nr:CoB--CoM heterodisulfide reductase iron-sulfur subunit B family protein [Desulforadius tongensis]MBM7855401.1 heterodisulfide reductase subunit B [Desulforadius tongensis]
MKFAYYPGCSLESTGQEFDYSIRAVSKALDVELVELPDWVCCGSTSAHATSHKLALALPAQNLVIAEEQRLDPVVPCSACYNRLKTAEHAIKTNDELRKQVESLLGCRFTGEVQTKSALEAFTKDVGLTAITKRVERKLTGLKVVCYYGCLTSRPPEAVAFEDPENPQSMDKLMKALGAEPLTWSYKTDCCGASLSITKADIVYSMTGRILDAAVEAGAQAIVTTCPLCQTNLETRRRGGIDIPVFYFTELMGLAFGLPDTNRWFKKHMVDPMPLVRSLTETG